MLSGRLVVELGAALLGGAHQPLGEAVAAEVGQDHQVDVLDLLVLVQVAQQAAEGGRLEFGAGRVVQVLHRVTPSDGFRPA